MQYAPEWRAHFNVQITKCGIPCALVYYGLQTLRLLDANALEDGGGCLCCRLGL